MSVDDLILKALLEPAALQQVTLAEVEQLLREDAEAVTWAFTKSLQGVSHAA